MKLLRLSDFHLRSEAMVSDIDRNRLSPFLGQFAATVVDFLPDAEDAWASGFPSTVEQYVNVP